MEKFDRLFGEKGLVLKISLHNRTGKAIDEFCEYIENNTEGVEIYALSTRGRCWSGSPPLYEYTICIPKGAVDEFYEYKYKESSLKTVASVLWEAYQVFKVAKFRKGGINLIKLVSREELNAIFSGQPTPNKQEKPYEEIIASSKTSIDVYLGSKSDGNLEDFLLCDLSDDICDKEVFVNSIVQRTLNIIEKETARDPDALTTIFMPKAGFLTTFSETWIRRK